MGLDGACATIYGPIKSRRHGESLGVNLGSPTQKICSWGCIYCQCGAGENRAIGDADGVPSAERILAAAKTTLRHSGALDSVTIAGNSEPTAHPEFLKIVRELRKFKYAMRAPWILNCLSNGSELEKPEVLQACGLLDEIWLKLDAGTEDLFKKVNHPISKIGTLAQHVARIKRVKNPRVQSLFWLCDKSPVASNWNEVNRRALVDAYREIAPVDIHLTTVSREPASKGLTAVPVQELQAFGDQLRTFGFRVGVFP